MNQMGDFRLCSGCGEWAIWTPEPQRGPVYCCQACARGRGCDCAETPDKRTPAAEFQGNPRCRAWESYE